MNIYQAHVTKHMFALSESTCARTDCTCDRVVSPVIIWGTENSSINDCRTFPPGWFHIWTRGTKDPTTCKHRSRTWKITSGVRKHMWLSWRHDWSSGFTCGRKTQPRVNILSITQTHVKCLVWNWHVLELAAGVIKSFHMWTWVWNAHPHVNSLHI